MNVCEPFVWKETRKSFSKYVKLYGVLPIQVKAASSRLWMPNMRSETKLKEMHHQRQEKDGIPERVILDAHKLAFPFFFFYTLPYLSRKIKTQTHANQDEQLQKALSELVLAAAKRVPPQLWKTPGQNINYWHT